jgi:hypothetical protein
MGIHCSKYITMKKLKFLRPIASLVVLAVLLVALKACKKTDNPVPAPSIASFAPTTGKVGDQVVITGSNFDASAGNNLVSFNGTQATISAAAATSLTVNVPTGATTGKITVLSRGLTGVSSTDFTVTTTSITPVTTTVIQGELSGTINWTADQHYLLKGYVYVINGATLNIAAGTIIKGDKATKGALIVEQGAKIVAVGTASQPIVFTSNQPKGSRNYGDWGGVILCGKSPVNWTAAPKTDGTTGTVPSGFGQIEGGPRSLYGGTDAHDNSGTIQYARIEFGGVAFSQDNEINGLTLGGVGDGTTLDHIQVSYAGDDSYEWFGGSVNGKYLIAHRGLDDDFDTDNGFSGHVQFAVGLRDPNVADQSGSKGFESDSYQSTTNHTQATISVFSNVTIIGGVVNPNSTAYDPQFVSAIHNRKGSKQSYYNDVFIAYPAGLLISNETGSTGGDTYVANNVALVDAFVVQNCVFGGIPTHSTVQAYGIAPLNNASTADFDKNVVVVTNNTRSRTPTFPQADSTATFAAWYTSTIGGASYSGPYHWIGSNTYYNLADNNRFYYTAQTGVRLTNPFTLTNPNFFPTSSSPIQVGIGTATGVGIDASGQTPGSASPKVSPSFPTGSPADNAFFDKTVDYIGAFKYGGTDWTLLWTNWDPNNAEYGDAY